MNDKQKDIKTNPEENLIHEIEPQKNKFTIRSPYVKITAIFLSVTLLGIISGWGFAQILGFPQVKQNPEKTETQLQEEDSSECITSGVNDQKLFKDSAEGTLVEGGIDGEGEYHLQRPGGESQNVYLTSTTVDLSKCIGSKVRVRGQTFNAQVAGWFMEVGYLEVL